MLEHIVLAGASLVIAALIAVPIGLYTGHTGRWGTTVTNVANLGRAIPSYALLLVFFTLTGALGAPTTLPTLVLLAIPPLLVGVHVALREVDRDTIEAGRGRGMRELQVLRRVELPAGMPLILVGGRTAAVRWSRPRRSVRRRRRQAGAGTSWTASRSWARERHNASWPARSSWRCWRSPRSARSRPWSGGVQPDRRP
jgi:hypothetical protein